MKHYPSARPPAKIEGLEHAHRPLHLEPLTIVLGVLCAVGLGFIICLYTIGLIVTQGGVL